MSNRTKANFVTAIISFVVVSSVLFLASLYVINQGELLEEQLAALEEQNRQEASLRRLENIAEESVADRAELNNLFLLRESDSIDFLNQIESLAPKLGLTLSTEGLNQINDRATDTNWVEVNFSFTGPRKNVEAYVEILENVSYVSEVTNLTLSARSSELWNADITMRVQLLEYEE